MHDLKKVLHTMHVLKWRHAIQEKQLKELERQNEQLEKLRLDSHSISDTKSSGKTTRA